MDRGQAEPTWPNWSHRWEASPRCQAASLKNWKVGARARRTPEYREEEGSGSWWHPALLSGSLGPWDLAISPAPERCKPGSQPHQKLAASRPQLPNTSPGASFPGLGFTHHTGTGHCWPDRGMEAWTTSHTKTGRMERRGCLDTEQLRAFLPHICLHAKTILNLCCTSLLPAPIYPSFLPVPGQTTYRLNSPSSYPT